MKLPEQNNLGGIATAAKVKSSMAACFLYLKTDIINTASAASPPFRHVLREYINPVGFGEAILSFTAIASLPANR